MTKAGKARHAAAMRRAKSRAEVTPRERMEMDLSVGLLWRNAMRSCLPYPPPPLRPRPLKALVVPDGAGTVKAWECARPGVRKSPQSAASGERYERPWGYR